MMPTSKRNTFVIIQTRDLSHIRSRIEMRLKKFDRTFMEVMPGVWHLVTTSDIGKIRQAMMGAVTDYEDDRVLVVSGANGFAGWDGHRGQYVRTEALLERFILTCPNVDGRARRYIAEDLQPAASPEWFKADG